MRMMIAGLFSLLLGAVAFASPPAEAAQAHAHFKMGMAQLTLQKYMEAANEFEKAYLIDQGPMDLYELGECYRLARIPDRALHFYQAYLAARPHAANSAEVKHRIAELEKSSAHPAPATNPGK